MSLLSFRNGTSKCITLPGQHAHPLTACLLLCNPAEGGKVYLCSESGILISKAMDSLAAFWRMAVTFCCFSTVRQTIHRGVH